MNILLIKNFCGWAKGMELEVAEVIEHGGNYDCAKQYKINTPDGAVYVPSDAAKELPPPVPSDPVEVMLKALKPLVDIAEAYDNNALDDEARKFWGLNSEHQNTTPPAKIELYQGRGGKRLLTLEDCLFARAVVRGATTPPRRDAKGNIIPWTKEHDYFMGFDPDNPDVPTD